MKGKKMRYYVVSDIHGFYTELHTALAEEGFFEDQGPKKLIVCGDMMDRGNETLKLQDFMMDLFNKDQLIFVRGNHEDLLQDYIMDYSDEREREVILWNGSHHNSNGTHHTALSLALMTEVEAARNPEKYISAITRSPFYKVLMRNTVDYYETENYVFVHAFVPLKCVDGLPDHYTRNRKFAKDPDWRNATPSAWRRARWGNPFDLAEKGFLPDKILVFGHWNASYGRNKYDGEPEFGSKANFSPYYNYGYIAIDACTAYSGKVNCIVIED